MTNKDGSHIIHIRFFATLRDKAGVDRVDLEVQGPTTIDSLIGLLTQNYPQLSGHLPTALAAVNQEFAFRTDVVRNGDEVALFPPVSGGSDAFPEILSVTAEKLDLDGIIESIIRPQTGAICIFSGSVRAIDTDSAANGETLHLFYESYKEMADVKLRQVAAEIRATYPKVQGIALVQRIGQLEQGETTILVACAAGHRGDGCFDAAKYGIDRVKEIVPIWKKEIRVDGAQWVEGHYVPTKSDVLKTVPNRDRSDQQVRPTFSMICSACGRSNDYDNSSWHCPVCGGAFDLTGVPAFRYSDIALDEVGMWRYRKWLVPDGVELTTLGEGWTPLVEAEVLGRRVHLKLEFLNPSGSFKDRGAAVLASIARHSGIDQLHDDSSGNAGAALAAYAAKGGLSATLFVPKSASKQKLSQIKLYGANLRQVDGSRSDAAVAAENFADSSGSYYASHVWNPYSVFAYRTIAYEIWEQLGKSAPDIVIVPVGHGTQLVGISQGFADLFDAKLIESFPKLVGVQSTGCSPIADRFIGREKPQGGGSTIAEGIRILQPVRLEQVIQAIVRSHGDIITVSDESIMEGVRFFARLGFLIEPTSAVVWEALQVVSSGLSPDVKIVVSLTGSGHKIRDLGKLVESSRSALTQ